MGQWLSDLKVEPDALIAVRAGGGRLFILSVDAGHAGHAVNDFHKICDRGLCADRQRLTLRSGDRSVRLGNG